MFGVEIKEPMKEPGNKHINCKKEEWREKAAWVRALGSKLPGVGRNWTVIIWLEWDEEISTAIYVTIRRNQHPGQLLRNVKRLSSPPGTNSLKSRLVPCKVSIDICNRLILSSKNLHNVGLGNSTDETGQTTTKDCHTNGFRFLQYS